MYCIPFIHCKESKNNYTKFEDFELEAETDIISCVQVKLSGLPIKKKSNNKLVLKLSNETLEVKEEYSLMIDEHYVEITSPSITGLQHGLSTLKILMFTGKQILQHGTILDVPKFEHRGVFIDVSRGKMPRLDYLKSLVSFISDLKYNFLQLYFEDKYQLETDPNIGILSGAYSEDQIKELDEWCIEHKVELQPCIQTYSHLQGILNLPEYSNLSENENLFSLAAGNDKVYEFLDRVFSQILPWFTSKTININMDEAYDLGTGYTKNAVEVNGKGTVYLDHIKKVAEIAQSYGSEKIIIWGDIALKYKELLTQLPKNIIVSDWNYNPLEKFDSLNILQESGIDYWAAGGVSTWNTLFPRVYNSYTNLINYSSESRLKGAKGFLVTDWGDYGHFQPLGLSLYGYLIGAQQSYYASLIIPTEFEENCWPLIFPDIRIAEAFRLLMDSNLALNVQTDFKSMSLYYFFDDLFDGLSMNGNERYLKLTHKSFEVLENKGSEALKRINQVLSDKDSPKFIYPDEYWEKLFGNVFLLELSFSARATQFTGKKGILSLEIQEGFSSGRIEPEDILQYITEIKKLYSEFLLIRKDFETIWMKRAYWKGIESTLLIFDKAGVQLGEAVQWLSGQYRNMKRGNPPDSKMETYGAGKNYSILWTADFRNMWDRAYPWQ